MAAFLGTLHTVAGASSAQLTCSLPTCSVIGNIKCALSYVKIHILCYRYSLLQIFSARDMNISALPSSLSHFLPVPYINVYSYRRHPFIGLQKD